MAFSLLASSFVLNSLYKELHLVNADQNADYALVENEVVCFLKNLGLLNL
jgi:hypothetical protein